MSKTYTFSTFQQLVDRVPTDRIQDCMHELGILFSTGKAALMLTYTAQREALALKGITIPEAPEKCGALPSKFVWVDDGKGEVTARIMSHEGGELFAVKTTTTPPPSEISPPQAQQKKGKL